MDIFIGESKEALGATINQYLRSPRNLSLNHLKS